MWALLLLIPLLVLGFLWRRWHQERVSKLGDEALTRRLWSSAMSGDRVELRFLLLILAVGLLIIGWAGPYQPKGGTGRKQGSGVDVIIALDASRSMRAADLQPDRLSRAVSFINRLLDRLPEDRVGLIVFAGRAYLQVPLTTDRAAFRLALSSVRPESLPAQGTVLSSALDLATESFSKKERKYKALVLVTDGEDHDQGAEDAMKKAASTGVVLHAVGAGSPDGTPLYEPDGSPKLNMEGEPVVTKLDEGGLKTLAGSTGTYTRLKDANSTAATVASVIDDMPGRPIEGGPVTSRREYFPLLLALAFLMLLLERAVALLWKGKPAFKLASILLILIAAAGSAQAQNYWKEGDKHYRAGRFKEAAEAYQKAVAKTRAREAVQYNLGNALYSAKQYDAAREAYTKASTGKIADGAIPFNEGNSWAQQGQWDKAVDAYRRALRSSPGAADAQYNLSYALQMLKKQKNNGKPKEKKDDQQKNKPDQKQKNQQSEPQQSKPSNLSKEQAEKLLQSLRREEGKVLDRQNQQQGEREQPLQDW
jgi:Ca-activated chloride channel family protein